MGSSGQKTKGPFANICQAYKNQLCGLEHAAVRRDTAEHVRHVALARGAEDPHVLGRIRKWNL